ncbi:hypothetical protein G6011_08683 [Alternaria panax]|uniref:Uncharacterized protein n=1 Tax=Alternaria panax TaxID=48097 RepID=A0AAD4FJM7_9PLEO|nr:hypothetical protein G6011_08683 [Alternaria panax]
MASVNSRPLGQQTLRGFGIFQAIISIPTMIVLGFFASDEMVFPYHENFYYFFALSMTAFMSAGIAFIVYVQRKAIATPYQALMFEVAKSVLATGLWLWLILDSAFGPWRVQHHYHAPDTHADPDYVKRRIQHDALASLVLIIFFYPPLGYSYVVWRTKGSHGDIAHAGDDGENDVDREERAPLLSQASGRTLG